MDMNQLTDDERLIAEQAVAAFQAVLAAGRGAQSPQQAQKRRSPGTPFAPHYPSRLTLAARGFAIGHGFGDAHPDIDQAQAADYSAHETVHQELLQRGIGSQQ